MFFSREYECKLDAKGRLVLPAKVKSALPQQSGNNIVVTRGFEPCLVVYPKSEWDKVFEKVAGLNEFNIEYRRFQRNFLRGNTEVELDKIGRFGIPKSLIKHAELEKEAIVVGLGNRIEIWNPEVYDEFLIKDEEEFAQMAEQFLGDKKDAAEE